LSLFHLFRGGQGRGGRNEPPVNKEQKSYDQLMDELTVWNIGHTDILKVLRDEIGEERFFTWSQALETGVRRGLFPSAGKIEESRLFPVYLDLYRFVKTLKIKLVTNPTMGNAKGMEKIDAISACILCGIRTLQRERGAKRLINTFQWKLLERYLG
jgi:hypothetical protein